MNIGKIKCTGFQTQKAKVLENNTNKNLVQVIVKTINHQMKFAETKN